MNLALITPQLTGNCPTCQGTFESCTCTGIEGGTLAPRAGWLEDEERRDNHRGYERDETDTSFRRLVGGLVADGDARARAAGRRARRTLAEMAPGYERQPVLLLTRPLVMGACTSCRGAGGQTVDTSSDGVSRQHCRSCTACSGTGAAR